MFITWKKGFAQRVSKVVDRLAKEKAEAERRRLAEAEKIVLPGVEIGTEGMLFHFAVGDVSPHSWFNEGTGDFFFVGGRDSRGNRLAADTYAVSLVGDTATGTTRTAGSSPWTTTIHWPASRARARRPPCA